MFAMLLRVLIFCFIKIIAFYFNNEAVMYGDGTSVLESIICSFPQERASVVSSSGYLRKSGQEDYLREQRGDHLYDFDCHQQMRESNRNNATDICRTSRKLNLNNLNKECYQVPGAISTKTDRTKYFNSNNKKSVNQHEEQKMTKNQS